MAVGDLVRAVDYETLRVQVATIMGTGVGDKGYGQPLASSNNAIIAAENNRITAAQWLALRTDMVKARQHQIGFPIGTSNLSDGLNLLVPSVGTIITDELLQQYIDMASRIEADRLLVAPSELTSDLLVVGRQTNPWNGRITHTATLTGSTSGAGSAENLRFFFNAGGSLTIQLTRTGGTEDNSKNESWNDLFDSIGDININYTTTTNTGLGINVTNYNTGYYDLNQNDFELILNATETTTKYPGNRVEVYAKRSTDNRSIIIKTEIIDGYTATSGSYPDDNPNGVFEIRVIQNRPASSNVYINPLTSDQTITAGAALAPTYKVTVAGGSLVFSEGATITLLVETTNVPNNTQLFWSTTGSVTAADFASGQNTGDVYINNNTGTFDLELDDDQLTEGIERFKVQLRKDSASGNIMAVSSEITVNDTSKTPATYSITQSATSVGEGQSIIFTVTTTDVEPNTVLYWRMNPVTGSINASDFTDAKIQGQVVIGIDGVGTFSRTLANDLVSEGTETFKIGIYPTAVSNSLLTESSLITVNDTSLTPPTYSIAVAGGITTYNEGETVTFNVTTTDFLGSKLYWTLIGTVNAQDFSGYGPGNQNGEVVIAGQAGTIQLIVANDLTTEGDESFAVQLRTGSTSGPVVATSTAVNIKDTSKNPPVYVSITPSVTVVNEGSTVTFNVVTNFVPDGTQLNWVIEPLTGSLDAADFVDNTLQGTFFIGMNKASIVRQIKNDITTEGVESFRMKIYHPSDVLVPVLTSVSVAIADTSRGIPTYAITTSGVTSVNEGTPLTLYVNTTNVDDGTILYWNVKPLSSTAVSPLFYPPAIPNSNWVKFLQDFGVWISPIGQNQQRTFTYTLYFPQTKNYYFEASADDVGTLAVDGVTVVSPNLNTENWRVVYNSTRQIAQGWHTITISCTDIPGVAAGFAGRIKHDNSSGAVLWTTRDSYNQFEVASATGGPTPNDFDVFSGSLTVNSNTATIVLTPLADSLREGAERFSVELKGLPGASSVALANSETVTINDTSTGVVSYSVTPSRTSLNEGDSVVFTITAMNAGNNPTVYWKVRSLTGTINPNDFVSPPSGVMTGVEIALTGSGTTTLYTASVTLQLERDITTEGSEAFVLDISETNGGAIVASSDTVTVNDSTTCNITNVTTVNEGNPITFTITTTGVADGTKLYWSIIGTASASDFTTNPVGEVTITSNRGSVTLNVAADARTEGNETFSLQVRRTSATGPVIATGPQVTIIDTSKTPKSITIVPNKTEVLEGTSVVFNVTTKGYANGTQLSWEIVPYKPALNVMFIVDTSGSMDWDMTYNGQTYKREVVAGMLARDILNCLTGSYESVKVHLLTFASAASKQLTAWSDPSVALSKFNFGSNSGTDFRAATTAAIAAWADSGKLANSKNFIYFISDGEPNQEFTASNETTWKNFLNTNLIVSRAYAIGQQPSIPNMNRIAWNGEIQADSDVFVTTATISCDVQNIGDITVSDFDLPVLTGSTNISSPGEDGTASFSIPLKLDNIPEGREYFVVNVKEGTQAAPVIYTSPSISIKDV